MSPSRSIEMRLSNPNIADNSEREPSESERRKICTRSYSPVLKPFAGIVYAVREAELYDDMPLLRESLPSNRITLRLSVRRDLHGMKLTEEPIMEQISRRF